MPTPQREEERGYSMAELHREEVQEEDGVGRNRHRAFESDLDAPMTGPHIQQQPTAQHPNLSTTSIPAKSAAVSISTDALDLLLQQDAIVDNAVGTSPSPTPSNHHERGGSVEDGDRRDTANNITTITYPLPVRLEEGNDRLRLLAPSWALVDTGGVEVVDGTRRVVQALRVVAILDWAPNPNVTSSQHPLPDISDDGDSDDSDMERRIHALHLKREYAISDERGTTTATSSPSTATLSVAGVRVANLPMHQSAVGGAGGGSGAILPSIPAIVVLTKEQFAANQHILHPSAGSLPSAPKYLGAEVFMPIDSSMTVYNGGVRRMAGGASGVERYSLVDALEGGVTYEAHPASDTIPHSGRCITASVPHGLGLVMQFEEGDDCRRVGGQLMLALDEV